MQAVTTSPTAEKIDQPRKKKQKQQDDVDKQLLCFLEKTQEQNENVHFYTSMAQLTSQLPILDQMKVRFAVHKVSMMPSWKRNRLS